MPRPILEHLEAGGFSVCLTPSQWHAVALDECHKMKINKSMHGGLCICTLENTILCSAMIRTHAQMTVPCMSMLRNTSLCTTRSVRMCRRLFHVRSCPWSPIPDPLSLSVPFSVPLFFNLHVPLFLSIPCVLVPVSMSLFLSLLIFLFLYLCLFPCPFLSVSLSLHPVPVSVHLCLSLHPCHSISIPLSLSFSLPLSHFHCLYLSVLVLSSLFLSPSLCFCCLLPVSDLLFLSNLSLSFFPSFFVLVL